jgi:hypothetical protein
MRVLLCLVLAGCTDGVVTGTATSSIHPDVSSSAFVDNVVLLDPPGTYRRWTVKILEADVGTDCVAAGDPLVAIDIYTLYDSAPRGFIPLSETPPPVLFPAAYATVVDGTGISGSIMISAAATTKLIGSLSGYVNLDGATRALDITFEAPTCQP